MSSPPTSLASGNSVRATLSEARHARLLLHVVDASSPQAEDHIRAVTAVLKELECDQKPTLLVLNKIDKLQDRSLLTLLEAHHPRAVAVSGLTGEGVSALEDAVMGALAEEFADAEIVTDAGNGRVLATRGAVKRGEGFWEIPSAEPDRGPDALRTELRKLLCNDDRAALFFAEGGKMAKLEFPGDAACDAK